MILQTHFGGIEVLDLDETRHLAELSKISLTEAELQTLADEMEQIIRLMDTVAEFQSGEDAFAVDPTAYEALRADQVAASMPREDVLSNAQVRTDACFQVPKVV